MTRGRELAPPTAEPQGDTSNYGPAFVIGCVVGGACVSFGLVSLLGHAGSTRPWNFSLFFVGLALVHDLVLVPLVLAAAWVVRKGTPRVALGAVLGAVAVSAIVFAFSLPALRGWGAQPDNPSFLPRNYAFGLAVALAAVWFVVGIVVVARLRGARRRAG